MSNEKDLRLEKLVQSGSSIFAHHPMQIPEESTDSIIIPVKQPTLKPLPIEGDVKCLRNSRANSALTSQFHVE